MGRKSWGLFSCPFLQTQVPHELVATHCEGKGETPSASSQMSPPALEAGSSGGATLKVFIHHFEPALNPYLRVP